MTKHIARKVAPRLGRGKVMETGEERAPLTYPWPRWSAAPFGCPVLGETSGTGNMVVAADQDERANGQILLALIVQENAQFSENKTEKIQHTRQHESASRAQA